MSDNMIQLVTAAAELDTNPNRLAARLAEHVTVDPESGLRMLPTAIVRSLIAEQAARAAEAAARRAASPPNPTIARVKAIRRRQEEMRAAGVLDADAPALVAIADGADRLAAAGRRLDELRAAERRGHIGVGAMFNPRKD